MAFRITGAIKPKTTRFAPAPVDTGCGCGNPVRGGESAAGGLPLHIGTITCGVAGAERQEFGGTGFKSSARRNSTKLIPNKENRRNSTTSFKKQRKTTHAIRALSICGG